MYLYSQVWLCLKPLLPLLLQTSYAEAPLCKFHAITGGHGGCEKRSCAAVDRFLPRTFFFYWKSFVLAYMVTHVNGKNPRWLSSRMFCCPTWTVGRYSRGPPAVGAVIAKSTEGFLLFWWVTLYIQRYFGLWCISKSISTVPKGPRPRKQYVAPLTETFAPSRGYHGLDILQRSCSM